MMWALTALSLMGVILNIRKHRACFWIWTGTNASWAAIDWWAGLYAQAVLFAVYTGLAVWGLIAWSQHGR